MIRKFLLGIASILFVSAAFGQASQNIPIGKWREHLAYYCTHNVVNTGDRMLLAAESALFYVDKKTGEIERFSKVAGLSDAGVHVLAYDSASQTTVITYNNANIDIVQKGKVYNISDIRLKTLEGNKTINQVIFNNGKAYLACGFGIVVLDLIRHEIADTYFIGSNSSAISINQIAINDTAIFAATEKYGILYAPKNSNALPISETWKNLSQIPVANLTDTLSVTTIFTTETGNLILCLNTADSDSVNRTVLHFNGTTVDTIFAREFLYKLIPSQNKIIKLSWQAVTIYDEDFNMQGYFSTDTTWNSLIRYDGSVLEILINDAVLDGNRLWMAHQNLGLIGVENYMGWRENAKEYYPNGPLLTESYKVKAGQDGTIYVAPSAYGAWRKANLYTFEDNWWDFLVKSDMLDTLTGVCDVAVDPRDPSHLMLASWWNGIIEVKNNRAVKVWDETNTDGFLQRFYGVTCCNVEYDKFGNLLIANSYGNYGLSFLNAHNEWGGFDTDDLINGAVVKGFIIDTFTNYKLLWTTGTKILLLNNEGRKLLIDPNYGAKDKTSTVNCLALDQDGEIWIGTEKGIKVIYSLADAFTNNIGTDAMIECNNIIYDDNGVLQYLLNFENVKCIMVDGANRKWIGTEQNGIYVYNANGSEELMHFTAENSPLLSNNIFSMAQDVNTGEVFISTTYGVVSYKAESMKGADSAGKLTAYPNPVRPDYTGIIAIKGFVRDSDVKITDISGNLVAHMKSIGGQAIWDGCNMKKERVTSGVYLIFGSANEGDETVTGKLLIIR
ncbi:MAG: hypothetical protein LBR17_09460 [Bacteroidales bacterium]|jgi:hypothetical protein|nr:hypothetical protein [Bacteroidales bacterium]